MKQKHKRNYLEIHLGFRIKSIFKLKFTALKINWFQKNLSFRKYEILVLYVMNLLEI